MRFHIRTRRSPRRPAHSRRAPHGHGRRTATPEKRGDEPLICSEFGVWGLPHPRDLLNEDGSEPWWFESGHDWNLGAAYPHGLETRFRDAQLAPIFGDLDRFVDAAQELQYRALKFQIEVLRWEAPISGYVITELNDVQWEANGLMDVCEPSAPVRGASGGPATAMAHHRTRPSHRDPRRREH